MTLDLAAPSVTAPAVSPLPVKPSIAGLPRAALAEFLREHGVPEKEIRMRVGQIWHWLYVRGATSFDDMTNVAKTLRALLDANATLQRPEIVREQVSADGHAEMGSAPSLPHAV